MKKMLKAILLFAVYVIAKAKSDDKCKNKNSFTIYEITNPNSGHFYDLSQYAPPTLTQMGETYIKVNYLWMK